jgi:hypothetical protein
MVIWSSNSSVDQEARPNLALIGMRATSQPGPEVDMVDHFRIRPAAFLAAAEVARA